MMYLIIEKGVVIYQTDDYNKAMELSDKWNSVGDGNTYVISISSYCG